MLGAVCSAIFQKSPRFLTEPPPRKALSERTPAPCFPASTMPEGDCTAATAIGKCGRVYGLRWARASFSVNQSPS